MGVAGVRQWNRNSCAAVILYLESTRDVEHWGSLERWKDEGGIPAWAQRFTTGL